MNLRRPDLEFSVHRPPAPHFLHHLPQPKLPLPCPKRLLRRTFQSAHIIGWDAIDSSDDTGVLSGTADASTFVSSPFASQTSISADTPAPVLLVRLQWRSRPGQNHRNIGLFSRFWSCLSHLAGFWTKSSQYLFVVGYKTPKTPSILSSQSEPQTIALISRFPILEFKSTCTALTLDSSRHN
jgi:hypothetical protein